MKKKKILLASHFRTEDKIGNAFVQWNECLFLSQIGRNGKAIHYVLFCGKNDHQFCSVPGTAGAVSALPTLSDRNPICRNAL